jgi:uncharacterized Zn finger protein
VVWRKRKSKLSAWGRDGWAPYVPVAERRQQAAKKIAAMTKKGEKVTPVVIKGRTIAATFWGKAWCDNLESYGDFSNRLPRGRTYVRNGSVVDLKITAGTVKALVSGSSLYKVDITIKPLEVVRWRSVIKSCAGKIDSLVELLQGKLSKGVMETVTSKTKGLFPEPKQITLKCSCPDFAVMCKHVAATLYGVGSRLDDQPELLFLLRKVDHMELIASASTPAALGKSKTVKKKVLEVEDLGSVFGIEISADTEPTKKGRKTAKPPQQKGPVRKVRARKVAPVPRKKKEPSKKTKPGKKR